ncbi:MAG: hypothetical protein M1820_004143 [Bogoriella megaspora]|nr:MAG: hypothetical protein M1820_004143 [Bogoriella megaspora]
MEEENGLEGSEFSPITSTPPSNVSRSSPKRLKTTDKDNESFDDQLAELSRIIGLPDEAFISKAGDLEKMIPAQRHYTRLEWVLQSLLGKLNTQGPTGEDARSSSKAWMLLHALCLRLPTIITLRHLRSHQFTLVLERSLGLIAAHLDENREHEGSGSNDEAKQILKKRKREEHQDRFGQPLVALRELFLTISSCLESVNALIFNGNENQGIVTTQETFTSKSATTEVANVVRNWLYCVNHFIAKADAQDLLWTSLAGGRSLLEPVLPLWERQEGNIWLTFCERCLHPVTLLLASLETSLECRSANVSIELENPKIRTLVATSSDIEKLLAKHAFGPMRSKFHSVTAAAVARDSRDGRSTGPGWNEDDEQALSENIEQLSPVLDHLHDANMSERNYAVLNLALPRLLDVALKSARFGRILLDQDRLWIEALFVLLGSYAGFSTQADDMSPLQANSISTLEAMLRILRKWNAPLSVHTLGILCERYSGVVDSDNSYGLDPQWSLVSAVLDLDADVFLPLESSRKQLPKGARNAPETLLRHLSTSKNCSSRLFSSTTEDLLGIQDSDVATSIDSIVRPLMRAYGQRRILDQLLRSLFEGLQRFYKKEIEDDDKSSLVLGTAGWILWEDGRFSQALTPFIEKHLTPSQVSDILRTYLDEVSVVFDNPEPKASETDSKGQQLGTVAAGLLITKYLVEAVENDEYQACLETQLSSLHKLLLNCLQHQDIQKWSFRWLIWRILSRAIVVQDLELDEDVQETSYVQLAVGSCTHVENDVGSRAAAYEALCFLTEITQYSSKTEGETMKVIQDCIEQVAVKTTEALTILQIEEQQFLESQWNGKPQSIATQGQSAIAYCSAFVRSPSCLRYMSRLVRQALLRSIFRLSSKAMAANAQIGWNFRLLWDSCLALINSNAPSFVQEDILNAIYPESNGNDEDDSSLRARAESLPFAELYRIPTGQIRRSQREEIIDRICRYLLVPDTMTAPGDVICKNISLIVKMMEVPNPTSRLSTDVSVIWKLAHIINGLADDNGEFDVILKVYEELVYLVLSHHLTTLNQSGSEQFISEHHQKLELWLQDPTRGEYNVGFFAVLTATFVIWNHPKVDTTMRWTEEKVRKILRKCISPRKELSPDPTEISSPSRKWAYVAALNAISGLPNDVLDQFDEKASAIMDTSIMLEEEIQKYLSEPLGHPYDTHVVVLIFKALTKLRAGHQRDSDVDVASLLAANAELSISSRISVLDSTKNALPGVDVRKRYLLVERLLRLSGDAARDKFSLLRILLSTLEYPAPEDSHIVHSYRSWLQSLGTELERAPNVRALCEIAGCLLLIFREKQWLVTQNGVESTIAALTFFTSQSGPRLPPSSGREIFRQICGIARAIINQHRNKIGGRFQILSPLLRNLLNGLFIHTGRQPSAPRLRPPQWIVKGKATFGAEEGAAFASVLTSLCEPSVSSVTSHKRVRGDSGLTDETRKAREYAGQFVQFVLAEYCEAQLRGRLPPEAKKRLLPGLYSAISCVSEDGLRAMNMAMNPSTRAMWKGLYDDWRRFGRSQG